MEWDRDVPPEIIKLLAHDIRWRLIKVLCMSDYRVHELVNLVNAPLNLVSYHLKKMREDQLVTARRSEADARDTYYSLDLDQLGILYRSAGNALHPAIIGTPMKVMTKEPPAINVLFVCTHNSARSQMAEGLLRDMSAERITVVSAGSHPTVIHPTAIQVMDEFGINIRAQQAKSLNSVTHIAFDYVITVCDRAREICPSFSSASHQIHWSFPDPTAIADDAQRLQMFRDIAAHLRSRIHYLLQTIMLFREKDD